MSKTNKSIFFLGKGGVGKSTASALIALALAQNNHRVLLISMDPAHNQSDIFETKLAEKSIEVRKNLSIKEVDLDYWVKTYLSDVEKQMYKAYGYLTAYNLEKYFSTIKYSPGIEEYALLLAFDNIIKNEEGFDFFLFDMPPTALTLKFFALPGISLIWLRRLLELRKELIIKKELITRIKFGKMEFEKDKVINKLNILIGRYQKTKEYFENKKASKINLVLNPDRLSLAESALIQNKLKEIKVEINSIFINRFDDTVNIKSISKHFKNDNVTLLPTADYPLIGIKALEQFLNQYRDSKKLLKNI